MDRPVVRLGRNSSLIGQTCSARGCDKIVSSFLGIPYAQAPVGEKRFREPQTLELWSGQRQADQFGPSCPQDPTGVGRTVGPLPPGPTVYDEDCLYLNVFTPNIRNSARLPVMVWIHGGSFIKGCTNFYLGTPLAAYDNVVVVSINYRLGAFGFLYTGDGPLDYHGNQGLLDQLEALRWVQKHISSFGGDPNNVTLFGESAGSFSVSFHQISPLSRGLFHRIICQSGPAIYPNAVWSAASAAKFFRMRLHKMSYTGTDAKSLVEFLNSQTTENILKGMDAPFAPTVLDGRYLTEEALTSYKTGRFHGVDCIIGFNSSEGNFFMPSSFKDRAAAEQEISRYIAKICFRGKPRELIEKITKLAKAEYMKSDNYVSDVGDCYGDVYFVAPSILQAGYQSAKSRTYVYNFDHRPCYSDEPDWVRSNHAVDVAYVFGLPFVTSVSDVCTEEDKQLSRRVMKYWTSFARTGNPNGLNSDETLWHQHTIESPKYLKMQGSTSECCNTDEVWPKRMKLWNHTVPRLVEQHSTTKAKL